MSEELDVLSMTRKTDKNNCVLKAQWVSQILATSAILCMHCSGFIKEDPKKYDPKN